jgi:hypothetical protein
MRAILRISIVALGLPLLLAASVAASIVIASPTASGLLIVADSKGGYGLDGARERSDMCKIVRLSPTLAMAYVGLAEQEGFKPVTLGQEVARHSATPQEAAYLFGELLPHRLEWVFSELRDLFRSHPLRESVGLTYMFIGRDGAGPVAVTKGWKIINQFGTPLLKPHVDDTLRPGDGTYLSLGGHEQSLDLIRFGRVAELVAAVEHESLINRTVGLPVDLLAVSRNGWRLHTAKASCAW